MARLKLSLQQRLMRAIKRDKRHAGRNVTVAFILCAAGLMLLHGYGRDPAAPEEVVNQAEKAPRKFSPQSWSVRFTPALPWKKPLPLMATLICWSPWSRC